MARQRREEVVKEEVEVKSKDTIRVRAKGRHTGQVVGYYGEQRRRSGEVFDVDKKMFSARWMEKVDEDAESEHREEEARREVPFSRVNPVTGDEIERG